MQKFVPLIRELAPHTAIISPCYLATEGCFGVASELVEYASLLAKGGNAPQQQQYHQQGAGAGGFKAFSKEPPERASFILRPDCSAFLEFIPQGGCAAGGGDHHETLRWGCCALWSTHYMLVWEDAGCATQLGASYRRCAYCRLHELREGESYELVVTNTQGEGQGCWMSCGVHKPLACCIYRHAVLSRHEG